MAAALASTHFAYPWKNGQAELTMVVGSYVAKMVYLQTVTHPSTNLAQR